MRELIDMASIYLALAVGCGALWFGIFSGGEVEASIVRALLCGMGAMAIGLAAKAIWVISAMVGSIGRKRGEASETEKAADGGMEGEWMSPVDFKGGE